MGTAGQRRGIDGPGRGQRVEEAEEAEGLAEGGEALSEVGEGCRAEGGGGYRGGEEEEEVPEGGGEEDDGGEGLKGAEEAFQAVFCTSSVSVALPQGGGGMVQ